MPDHAVNPGRVLLGMSGGMDSSVAAFLLRSKGWEVLGLTLITHDQAGESLEDVQAVAHRLRISWRSHDVRQLFQKTVVDDFVENYTNGRTPNPCVICNPLVKFEMLSEIAAQLEVPIIATGHYAKIHALDNGRFCLGKGFDTDKDQSYFMYRLSQKQLSQLIFPLGELSKSMVRKVAQEADLKSADGVFLADKPESQDCCFIPTGSYPDFIRQCFIEHGKDPFGQPFSSGPVVDTSGHQVGTHKGLIHYTIGQRKGFQVQTTQRLFVTGFDPGNNALIVGPFDTVLKKEIGVADPVYSGMSQLQKGERLTARIRYSAGEAPCRVYPLDNNSWRVVFDAPVAAPTPGQSCVLYRDGLIMAGGFISS
ncbi:MAG: tRNA 2-thiouridine(34) synthase MnmA [Saccharofermentanales bacterium]|nr:tRNA 2-thiouridine(34) synthase MnmA [Clostridiaceae bacterium]